MGFKGTTTRGIITLNLMTLSKSAILSINSTGRYAGCCIFYCYAERRYAEYRDTLSGKQNGNVAIVKRSSLFRQVVNSTGESVMALVTGLGKKSEMLCCC